MAIVSTNDELLWATPRKLNLRYGLVVLCVLSQLMTVWMSWPLWQVRPSVPWEFSAPTSTSAAGHVSFVMPAPLMPVIAELPQFDFGWLMVGSLGLVLLTPRWGVPVHTAVLLLSFIFDQYRTQPQFMANVALLWGCAYLGAREVARWVLVSLWLWAGLHKLLSPDWMGSGSWHSLNEINLYPNELYFAFAIFVAASEILLGILAIVKPRWAAYYCVALHLGIFIYLSPWLRNWNENVLPWNLCTAAVGYWVLLHSKPGWPANRKMQYAAAVLLIYPAGFYTGWIDHGISHVLYSDNHAIAMITYREPRDTSNDPPESEQLVPLPNHVDRGLQISGFGDLCVPFPNERRLHLIYFEQVGKPGQKMHIYDPRPWGGDEYFVKDSDGRVQPIDAQRFFTSTDAEVGGVAIDPPRAGFALGLKGAGRVFRDTRSPTYAVVVTREYYRPEILEPLGQHTNLEEIQLQGCPVTDMDLARLPVLWKLRGIGLDGTLVTRDFLPSLLKHPNLSQVYFDNGIVTRADLEAMAAQKE